MIVGLAGYLKSGKSEVARALQDKGFQRMRFAQPLKDMIKALGLTDAHVDGHLKEEPCELLCGRTPRWAMQTLGTEWGRDLIHSEIWITLWRARALAVLGNGGKIVVDDVRFHNELRAVRELDGEVWRVNRPGLVHQAHVSESYIGEMNPDRELMNTRDIEYLRRQVFEALEEKVRLSHRNLLQSEHVSAGSNL